MSRSAKILTGIGSLFPIVSFLLIFPLWFFFVVSLTATAPNEEPSPLMMIPIFGFFVWMLLLALTQLGMTIFYIINIVRNDRLDQTMKIVWLILLFLLAVFIFPVYWFLYIWRDRT